MVTKKQNLQKKYSKVNSSEAGGFLVLFDYVIFSRSSEIIGQDLLINIQLHV